MTLTRLPCLLELAGKMQEDYMCEKQFSLANARKQSNIAAFEEFKSHP